MVKTPQRGRRSNAPIEMINIRIDPELKHELKKTSLDARVTTTTFITRLIEEAVDGADGAPAPQGVLARPAWGATKLGFNIDPDLHARLKRAALAQDVSVTAYLTRLVEHAVRGAGGADGAGVPTTTPPRGIGTISGEETK